MNKLVFTLENDWGKDLVLVANNHKDLEDYLTLNYDWHKFSVEQFGVPIVTREGCEPELAALKWVKHI